MNEKYYAAYIKDDEQRKKSSSGGLAYALSEYMIKKGANIYGVEYTEDFKGARYAKITSVDELFRLNGSKYITTDKHLPDGETVYNKIYNDLESDTLVVFIGTPCEVAALYRYLENKDNNYQEKLFTIDFICQGPVNAKIQKDYITFLEKKYCSPIIDFSVRFKNPSWKPVYLRAEFENGKKHIRPLYETDFGRAFMIYGQKKCYHCKYKAREHCSDITIGDFWGLNPEDEGYNETGTSVVIVHSEYGIKVLSEMDTVTLFNYNEKKAIEYNPMYSESRKKHVYLDRFKQEYDKVGLHKTIYLTRSFPSRIKYIVKFLFGMKPY